jgi:hypothetical protein
MLLEGKSLIGKKKVDKILLISDKRYLVNNINNIITIRESTQYSLDFEESIVHSKINYPINIYIGNPSGININDNMGINLVLGRNNKAPFSITTKDNLFQEQEFYSLDGKKRLSNKIFNSPLRRDLRIVEKLFLKKVKKLV